MHTSEVGCEIPSLLFEIGVRCNQINALQPYAPRIKVLRLFRLKL